MTRKALGRGLDALLPAAVAPPARSDALDAAPGERRVPIDAIVPNPEQPRTTFAADGLEALADSIRQHGVLQPLVVRELGEGRWQLIAGERRLRAARLAGFTEVPVVRRDAAETRTRLELALIENLQREDLSALEEAEAYRQLIDVHGLTQDEVARAVGKSRPAIANTLRLLALPDEVKRQLAAGMLSAGHARAVLSVDGADERVAFAREILERRLPKREAEQLATARRTVPRPRTATAGKDDPNWRALADELTRDLGTRVRLVPRARGGVVEIEFYSFEELDGLVARLRAAAESRRPGLACSS